MQDRSDERTIGGMTSTDATHTTLTPEQIEFYEQEGYVIVRGVLSSEEIARLHRIDESSDGGGGGAREALSTQAGDPGTLVA